MNKQINWKIKCFFHRTSEERPPNVSINNIMLALKGKPNSVLIAAKFPDLNDDLAAYIRVIGQLLEDGKLVPNKVEVVAKAGFDGVQDAVDSQRKGTLAGKKIVIKLQKEWRKKKKKKKKLTN